MDLHRRIEKLEQQAGARDETPAFRPLTDEEIASGDFTPFPTSEPKMEGGVVVMFPTGSIPSQPSPDGSTAPNA